MSSNSAKQWADKLSMEAHPEGGYFREMYRSNIEIEPEDFNGTRSLLTHIYFLLEEGQFSAFHRIQSDELWHWYDGGALEVLEIRADGSLIRHLLGSNIQNEEMPFCVVQAESWFASRPLPDTAFALVGCSVAPGFDFADFELADREVLIDQYPQHSKLIAELTRESAI